MLLHSINLMPDSGNDHNQSSGSKKKHPDDRLGINRLMQEDKRQSQLFFPILASPLSACVRNTIPHAIARTTKVRIAVARFELTPSIPTFARMDVSAAKTAEPIANNSHILLPPFLLNLLLPSLLCNDMSVKSTFDTHL